MFLIDTDVMVEVHRRSPAALAWMSADHDEEVGLPGLVVLELLRGCETKLEARQLERLTSRFRIYWPTRVDNERARHAFADARLAHGIDVVDMLIAETAVGLGATLLTFNDKHFRAVPDLQARAPYQR